MKQKKISLHDYNKKIEKIIAMGLPMADTLIAMLDEASRYSIKGGKK